MKKKNFKIRKLLSALPYRKVLAIKVIPGEAGSRTDFFHLK